MKKQINRSVVLLSLVLLTLSTVFLSVNSLYAGDKMRREFPSIGPSVEETDIAVNYVLAHLNEIQSKFAKASKFQQILLTYGEKWVIQKCSGKPIVSIALDDADQIVGFGLHLQILDNEGKPTRNVTIALNKNLEITGILDFPVIQFRPAVEE